MAYLDGVKGARLDAVPAPHTLVLKNCGWFKTAVDLLVHLAGADRCGGAGPLFGIALPRVALVVIHYCKSLLWLQIVVTNFGKRVESKALVNPRSSERGWGDCRRAAGLPALLDAQRAEITASGSCEPPGRDSSSGLDGHGPFLRHVPGSSGFPPPMPSRGSSRWPLRRR